MAVSAANNLYDAGAMSDVRMAVLLLFVENIKNVIMGRLTTGSRLDAGRGNAIQWAATWWMKGTVLGPGSDEPGVKTV